MRPLIKARVIMATMAAMAKSMLFNLSFLALAVCALSHSLEQ